jgi:hypothetical protein
MTYAVNAPILSLIGQPGISAMNKLLEAIVIAKTAIDCGRVERWIHRLIYATGCSRFDAIQALSQGVIDKKGRRLSFDNCTMECYRHMLDTQHDPAPEFPPTRPLISLDSLIDPATKWEWWDKRNDWETMKRALENLSAPS